MEEIRKLRTEATHKKGADAEALYTQVYSKLEEHLSSTSGEERELVLVEWADTLATQFENDTEKKKSLLELTNKKYDEAHSSSSNKHTILYKWGNFWLHKGLDEKKKGKKSEAGESFTQARNKYDISLELKHDYQDALSNLVRALNEQIDLTDGNSKMWFASQAAEKERLLASLKAGDPIPDTPSAPSPEAKIKKAAEDKDRDEALNTLNGAYGFSTQQEQTVKELKIAVLNNMTSVHIKQSKFDRAIDKANQVIALDAQNIKALFRRGKAYLANNDIERAKKDLLAAKEMAPEDKDIKNELILLDKKEKSQDAKQKQFYSKMF